MNPKPTDYDADSLTTTPSRRLLLTTPPCCHFLMCTPPCSLLSNGWQNRLLFSFHSFLLQKSLFSGGTLIVTTASGTPDVFPTPIERKYSIGSCPLTSSPSMTRANRLFYIAPYLTFPLLPPLLPFLAPGRCFKTEF